MLPIFNINKLRGTLQDDSVLFKRYMRSISFKTTTPEATSNLQDYFLSIEGGMYCINMTSNDMLFQKNVWLPDINILPPWYKKEWVPLFQFAIIPYYFLHPLPFADQKNRENFGDFEVGAMGCLGREGSTVQIDALKKSIDFRQNSLEFAMSFGLTLPRGRSFGSVNFGTSQDLMDQSNKRYTQMGFNVAGVPPITFLTVFNDQLYKDKIERHRMAIKNRIQEDLLSQSGLEKIHISPDGPVEWKLIPSNETFRFEIEGIHLITRKKSSGYDKGSKLIHSGISLNSAIKIVQIQQDDIREQIKKIVENPAKFGGKVQSKGAPLSQQVSPSILLNTSWVMENIRNGFLTQFGSLTEGAIILDQGYKESPLLEVYPNMDWPQEIQKRIRLLKKEIYPETVGPVALQLML